MRSVLFFLIVIATAIHAQQVPERANVVVQHALDKADKENKNVMVIFHASWCVWCHKMDSALYSKECGKLFDDHYVIVHITINENDKHRGDENPGGHDLLTKYHGDGQGIPFWAILDSKGAVLRDSQVRPDGAALTTPGKNMGCPVEQAERDYFINILKKTSTLKDAELAIISKKFSTVAQGH